MMDIGANLGEEFFGNLETDIPVEDDIDFDNFWNDALLGDPPGRDGPAPDSPGNRQSFGSTNLKVVFLYLKYCTPTNNDVMFSFL